MSVRSLHLSISRPPFPSSIITLSQFYLIMLLLIFICLGAALLPGGSDSQPLGRVVGGASQLHHVIIPQLGTSYRSDLYPLSMR